MIGMADPDLLVEPSPLDVKKKKEKKKKKKKEENLYCSALALERSHGHPSST
jgi:hypothetical protein